MPFENNELNFQTHLENRITSFLKEIRKINKGTIVRKLKREIPRIERFSKCIIESNKLYNEGKTGKAYILFKKELNRIKRTLLYDRNSGRSMIYENTVLFRARIGDTDQYQLGEIFHVPFEKRDFISTARYSLPGIPCLYGSNSTYLCWIEMKKPSLNEIHLSQLKWTGQRGLMVLDLSERIDFIVRMMSRMVKRKHGKDRIKQLNIFDDWIIATFLKWPLQLVTSTIVKHTNAPHKPEYVFPQFLMQWINEQSAVNGIKYFSVSGHKFNEFDSKNSFNYAIPVKTYKSKGHCDFLKDNFKLTYPITWTSLFNSKPQIINKSNEEILKEIKFKTFGRPSVIALNVGQLEPYWKSVFGLLEIEISKHKFYKIP